MDLVTGGVDQDVVGDDHCSERVGLVLPGLPGDRRALQAGQVPGDPARPDFKRLEQRRAAGHRVTLTVPAALGWPGGHEAPRDIPAQVPGEAVRGDVIESSIRSSRDFHTMFSACSTPRSQK